MTITNNIVAKLAVAFVAVAMAFTLAAPSVKAQDVSSMSLEQLIALVNQLQNQLSGSSATGSCSFTFTRSLGQGSTGADVMNLQKFLNMSADTQVAAAGSAGGPGSETSYYGPATAAAVSKFQTKYSADVLVPVGLTTPTGYFGPSSMAKANALCAAGGSTDGSTGGSTGGLQGGVGDIEIDQTSSGIDDEVMEGDEDVEILGFDVEADGSDVRVTSVRVEFEHEGNGSDRLDDYVEEVTIWLDGDQVGSADADDFNESSDIYSRNITLTDAIVREGDEGRFTVAVTALNNIDSDDIGKTWEVALGQVRFEDATGAILTDTSGNGVVAGSGNGNIAEDFTFEDLSSAGDVEITIAEDDEDINDAHTVQVDDSSDTKDVEILSFTLEADGSDMELQSLVFDITSSGAGVTEIANDFRLMMGDEEVGDVSIDGGSFASSTDTTRTITVSDLDDDDVVIDEGDTVSFTLVADINDIDGAFSNGDYLGVSLANSGVDADDENGDTVTDVKGSATSNNISFASEGITVKMTDDKADELLNKSDDSTDDQGRYEITFEVSAFEETAYVELEAASSTVEANAGASFSIQDANTGDIVAAGTSTPVLTRVSGGTVQGNFVRINPGQTATFKLVVYYDAATTGIYRAQLNGVGYSPTAATQADEYQAATPAADFQSGSVQVRN